MKLGTKIEIDMVDIYIYGLTKYLVQVSSDIRTFLLNLEFKIINGLDEKKISSFILKKSIKNVNAPNIFQNVNTYGQDFFKRVLKVFREVSELRL